MKKCRKKIKPRKYKTVKKIKLEYLDKGKYVYPLSNDNEKIYLEFTDEKHINELSRFNKIHTPLYETTSEIGYFDLNDDSYHKVWDLNKELHRVFSYKPFENGVFYAYLNNQVEFEDNVLKHKIAFVFKDNQGNENVISSAYSTFAYDLPMAVYVNDKVAFIQPELKGDKDMCIVNVYDTKSGQNKIVSEYMCDFRSNEKYFATDEFIATLRLTTNGNEIFYTTVKDNRHKTFAIDSDTLKISEVKVNPKAFNFNENKGLQIYEYVDIRGVISSAIADRESGEIMFNYDFQSTNKSIQPVDMNPLKVLVDGTYMYMPSNALSGEIWEISKQDEKLIINTILNNPTKEDQTFESILSVFKDDLSKNLFYVQFNETPKGSIYLGQLEIVND